MSDRIDLHIVDMHGNLRGKWLPATQLDKLLAGQVRLPLSTQSQDIWGDDNDSLTGMALSLGDPDGACIPEPDTLRVQPWNPATRQVLASLHSLDGTPSFCDPRHRLASVIERFTARGLRPVAAFELEFYLLDSQSRDTARPRPPAELAIAGRPKALQLYDPRAMDRMEPVLDRIHSYAASLDIPADATLSEFGPGQFEINLAHRTDALRAADDAVLFKRVIDRAAMHDGLLATFMAKPYTEHSGSGMHVHVSVIDEAGNNIFDAGEGEPRMLQCAVKGLLDTLLDVQLLLAPNGNSYRRLQPESYAPVRLDWGIDHRGAAIRLPEISGAGARLEHRVAGADANPYLVLAAVLGGILKGLDAGESVDTPALDAGDTPAAPELHHDWLGCCERFLDSPFVASLLGEPYQRVFGATKRHEALWFNRRVSDTDWSVYLPRI